MASYLKPRRGTYSTAKNQLSTAATCLKNGEIFFELNSSGAGKGMGKIKMGDGSTSSSSLPYFLSLTDNGITFTATESTNQLSYFSSGVTIPNAFRYIRSTLSYLVTQVTNLNNDKAPYVKSSPHLLYHYQVSKRTDNGLYTAYIATQNCLMIAIIAAVSDGSYIANVQTSSGLRLAYNENAYNVGTSVYITKNTVVTIGNGSYDLYFYSL